MTYEAVPQMRASSAVDEPFMRLVAAMVGPRHEAAEADGRAYREFIEALGVAVYTTDAEGRITYFNEAAVELWGRRPELGEEWCGSWKLFWADGTPMLHSECPMAMCLHENRPIRGLSAMAQRPDGTFVDVEPYPTPLRDADGRLSAPSTSSSTSPNAAWPKRSCAPQPRHSRPRMQSRTSSWASSRTNCGHP